MKARTIICLLALACLLAGVEARNVTPSIPGVEGATLIATVELLGAENISIVVGYPFSGMLMNTSRLPLDVGKRYTLILIEQEEE